MALDWFATQNGATYSAEVTRRAMFAWAARTGANSPGILAGGLMSATDLQVTAPASGMTVNVGVGEAILGGTEAGAQGGYYVRNSSTYSANVAAANATNPRIDAVVITMADAYATQPSDVGATTNGPVIAVITGTPTAGATLSNLSGAPAVPASSLLLAWLLVPAAAPNIITADISNVPSVVGLLSGTNYLQLLGSAQSFYGRPIMQMNLGNSTWTFPGATSQSSTTTVSHGLGRSPIGVFVQPTVTTANEAVFTAVFSFTSSQFSTNCQFASFQPASSSTYYFNWLAIG